MTPKEFRALIFAAYPNVVDSGSFYTCGNSHVRFRQNKWGNSEVEIIHKLNGTHVTLVFDKIQQRFHTDKLREAIDFTNHLPYK